MTQTGPHTLPPTPGVFRASTAPSLWWIGHAQGAVRTDRLCAVTTHDCRGHVPVLPIGPSSTSAKDVVGWVGQPRLMHAGTGRTWCCPGPFRQSR